MTFARNYGFTVAAVILASVGLILNANTNSDQKRQDDQITVLQQSPCTKSPASRRCAVIRRKIALNEPLSNACITVQRTGLNPPKCRRDFTHRPHNAPSHNATEQPDTPPTSQPSVNTPSVNTPPQPATPTQPDTPPQPAPDPSPEPTPQPTPEPSPEPPAPTTAPQSLLNQATSPVTTPVCQLTGVCVSLP